jgi:hypothetical protein
MVGISSGSCPLSGFGGGAVGISGSVVATSVLLSIILHCKPTDLCCMST